MKRLQIHYRMYCLLAMVLGLGLGSHAPLLAMELTPEVVGRWPSFRVGQPSAVTVAGNFAYVSAWQGGLHVIDISDPLNPKRVGGLLECGAAHDVTVSGNYAYVASYCGLFIVDVSDPSRPRMVGKSDKGYSSNGMAVSGHHVYLVAGGLHVLDVSSPSRPQEVGVYEIEDGASMWSLAIAGDRARACITFARRTLQGGRIVGLQVLDIDDPTRPRLLGSYEYESESPPTLALASNYAYLVRPYEALEVIDVSDPMKPSLAGFLNHADLTVVRGVNSEVVYCESYAASSGERSIQVIDVSSPQNPTLAGRMDSAGDIAVAGDLGYLVNWANGFEVWDFSTPTSPDRTAVYDFDHGTVFEEAYRVRTSGNFVFLNHQVDGGGVRGTAIIDVTDPASPRFVGNWGFRSYQGSVVPAGDSNICIYANGLGSRLDIFDLSDCGPARKVGEYARFEYDNGPYHHAPWVSAEGDYAYMLEGMFSETLRPLLHVVDIRNPAEPRRIGMYEWPHRRPEDPWRFPIQGEFRYEKDAEGDWKVIDISDPANEKPIGTYAAIAATDGVTVAGDFAYRNENGLRVIDISQPAVPYETAVYDWLNEWQYRLPLSEAFDYVKDENRGWQVMDASDPSAPKNLGSLATIASVTRVEVWGDYVLVPSGKEGLQVVDITDPKHPREIGSFPGFTVYDLTIAAGRIFAAANYDGLLILELPPLFKSISRGNGIIDIAWEGFGKARLQRATSLADPDWRVLVGSENTNRVTLPLGDGPEYFRLVKP
jgi:hypothetical protein